MKKLLLFILAIVSVTISSFAQEGASVFKNYKYRFQKYRILTTSFNMGNDNRVTDNIPQSSSSNNSSSAFDLRGAIQFSQSINTQKLQQFTSFGGAVSYERDKSYSSATNYSNSNGSSIAISVDQQNRFYKNNHFFELNYYIGNREFYNKSRFNGFPKHSNQIDMNGSIKIGAGNGRLEMVGDVAQALFILKDFKNRGIITNYTSDDATALAKAITRIYNTRIIDFRYRLRGQLGMLDSFFVSSGLIDGNKQQSNYFISLFDNWLNNNYVQRFCGSRFSYGISYGNQYSNDFKYQAISSNYLSHRYINSSYTPGVYFNYTHEKPISLYWQESFSVDLMGMRNYAYEYYNRIDTSTITIYSSKNLITTSMLNVHYKISWYPNSRTYFNAGIAGSVWYSVASPPQWQWNPIRISLTPYANMFYFVSPKVNFNIGISPRVQFTHFFVHRTSNINAQIPALNAGLNYYIY